ncbi:DUF4097 family beta strand repeat-containing protein [Streptomyces sp. NPDC005752]|uniref:DUF4097 family beta strand repeat-containing protein n=1 Tax=Streptomyces sp. NPDC005752 TaxID=3157065 RepID=UPI0033CFF656
MSSRTFTHGRRLAALLLAAPLVAACAGGDSGGRLGPTAPEMARGQHLVITTGDGVRLRPSDDGRAVVDPRVASRWSHREDTWVLDLSCGDHDERCPHMPVLDVPAGVSVAVTARNAGIDVAGLPAELDLTTVNGDVTVARSGGDDATVRLVTRNGSVRADGLRSGTLHAETVNGDVRLDSAASPARLSATTENGSVRVGLPPGAPAYDVTATTRNGRTSVTVPTAPEGARHTMTLGSVNGDVTAARG